MTDEWQPPEWKCPECIRVTYHGPGECPHCGEAEVVKR